VKVFVVAGFTYTLSLRLAQPDTAISHRCDKREKIIINVNKRVY